MEQSNYRRRTYTPEEDAIIINCVKESPDNISRALRQASQSIGNSITMQTFKKGDIARKEFNKYKRKR